MPSDSRIDWNDCHYKTFPRITAPYRREMVFAVYCPNCDRKRYLRKSDALRANICGQCQREDAANKLPLETRLKHIGANHLANPSILEQLVINLLDGLNNQAWGIDYKREQVITGADGHPYLVDFVLTRRGYSQQIILEVDGDWVHARPGRPEFANRKDKALTEAGYLVYRLGESQVKEAINHFMFQMILPNLEVYG